MQRLNLPHQPPDAPLLPPQFDFPRDIPLQKEKVIVEAHEAGVEVLFQSEGIAVAVIGLELDVADQGVQCGTEKNELAGLGAAG